MNDVSATTRLKGRQWDPVVRLTHWGVVTIVIINTFVVGEESIAHVWAGYCLAALLALRLLWGVLGPKAVRLSLLPPSPARAIAHIRDISARRKAEHRTNNPLFALTIYAIWATLVCVVATGVTLSGPPRMPSAYEIQSLQSLTGGEVGEYELADRDDEGREGGEAEATGKGSIAGDAAEELHEFFVNLLYGLIALHVICVLFEVCRISMYIIGAMTSEDR